MRRSTEASASRRRGAGALVGAVALALLGAGCVPDASADAPPAAAPARGTSAAPPTSPPTPPTAPPTPVSTQPTTPTTTTAPIPTTTAPPAGPGVGALPDFGSQFHATWGDYNDTQRVQVLDRLAAMGATWVRVDVGWRTLEPERAGSIASWYLRYVEFTVDQARQRGINVILTLWNTPAWANGGADWSVPPSDPAQYGRIAGWLANHFRGRVAAWEIWNEPDLSGFFVGGVSQYVGLLRAAYPAIKAADPATKVVAGATEMNDTSYLSSMYSAGAKGYFDVISTHPYMGPADAPPELPDDGNPWRIDHVRAVRALMVANGDANKPIWFTEMGWSSHATAPGAPTWKRGVSEAQQADFAVRAMTFVGANHPYVDVMIWYNERAKVTGDVHEDNYGLMTRDLQPKPVYVALDQILD